MLTKQSRLTGVMHDGESMFGMLLVHSMKFISVLLSFPYTVHVSVFVLEKAKRKENHNSKNRNLTILWNSIIARPLLILHLVTVQ